MNDTKSALASKGVWGAVLAILATVLPSVLKAMHMDASLSPDLVDMIREILTVIGAGLSLYGRLTATKAIG